MSDTARREKRHAALYFNPKNSAAFKDLAARIRSDGGRTTLVWSQQWKGAENIMTEVRGVVVEEGCKNADQIVEAYRRYAVDVEIHFADSNGEFIVDEAPGIEESDEPVVSDELAAATLASCMEDEDGLEEQGNQSAATDSDVADEDESSDAEGGDSDSDFEDEGTSDASGEEGTKEPSDTR